MADNVAELGFAVDSKPLDDAQAKLKGVATEAQKTGQAVDDLNQKVGKTAPTMQTMESAAKRSGASVEELRARAAAFNAESEKLTAGRAASAIADVGKAAAAAAPAAKALETSVAAVGAAANTAAVGVRAKASALSDLDKAAHRMAPALNQLSDGLGAVLGATNAFRLGVAGLAAVAGGAVVAALAKVGDEAARAKRSFDALTGSQELGARTLEAVKKAAGGGSGAEFDAISKAVLDAAQGLETFASKNVIYANTGDNATRSAEGFAAALGKLRANMDSNGATAEEMARVFGAIGESIKKTGGLTSETFQKIRDESLPTARAISEAFGYKDIAEFQRQLERTPASAEQVVKALNQIRPAVEPLKTLESTSRDVGKAWNDLVKTFGESGGFTLAKSAIEAVSTIIKTTTGEIKALIGVFGAAGAAAASFADGAIAKLNSLADSAIAAAQKVASAVASMFTSSPAGGGAPSLSDTGDVSGGTSYSDSGGTYSSSYGGDGSSGFNPAAMDYGGGSSDYGYFASGGSFVVQGSGGTDSETVTFKATPGEVVTVSTPEQAASGIAALTPMGSSGGLEDLFDEQTKEIVDAINGLKVPAASGAAGAASRTSTTGSAASDPLGLLRSVGGGGFTVSGGVNKVEEDQKKRDAELEAIERELGGGFKEIPFDLGASFRGWEAASRGRGANVQRGPFTPHPNLDRGFQRLGEEISSATRQGTDRTSQDLSAVERASDETTAAVDSGSGAIVDATQTGFGGLQGALDAGLAAVASAIGSAFSGDGGGGGGGGSGSYDSMYGYDGGGASGGGDSSGGGYSGSSYDGGSGSSGNDGSVPYQGYVSDGSSGGNDPGTINYGGGDADAGYFADGGQFKVPGAGNTDSIRIRMRAKPGETVTVTPPGINVSPLMLNPGAGSAGVDFAGYKQETSTTKNVNIYVNPGMQAEQFIRSRAQIARAM